MSRETEAEFLHVGQVAIQTCWKHLLLISVAKGEL
jgi:hypothetical protein